MASPSACCELSFERDIKPLFRTKDRDSMMAAFDLFDYTDVVEHADAIVGALSSGQMPCDGAWPAAQVGISSSGLIWVCPLEFAVLPRPIGGRAQPPRRITGFR